MLTDRTNPQPVSRSRGGLLFGLAAVAFLVLGCLFASRTSGAADRPDIEREANRGKALDIIDLATKIHQAQRDDAAKEREKIESRVRRLQLLVAQREWALRHFEIGESEIVASTASRTPSPTDAEITGIAIIMPGRIPSRSGVVARLREMQQKSLLPGNESVPLHMRHWMKARESAKKHYLEFASKAHGQIASGRALNFFLDACGQTAMDHQLFREQMLDTRTFIVLPENRSPGEDFVSRMKEATERSTALLEDPDEAARPVRAKESLDARIAMLRELAGPPLFRREDLQQIVFQKGLTGPKVTVRLNDEPLPLDWPDAVRADPDCLPFCEAIEAAKAKAIAELRAGGPVSLPVQQELMQAADQLCDHVEARSREQFDAVAGAQGQAPSRDAQRAMQYVVAKRFLKELRGGIVRFLQAKRIEDVQIKPFPPEGVEAVSIDELMAYMARHGLCFGPADPNAETVYLQLFREMSRYYVDLSALKVAIERGNKKIADNMEQDQRLSEVQYDQMHLETIAAVLSQL